jgi:hypothetical protein
MSSLDSWRPIPGTWKSFIEAYETLFFPIAHFIKNQDPERKKGSATLKV